MSEPVFGLALWRLILVIAGSFTLFLASAIVFKFQEWIWWWLSFLLGKREETDRPTKAVLAKRHWSLFVSLLALGIIGVVVAILPNSPIEKQLEASPSRKILQEVDFPHWRLAKTDCKDERYDDSAKEFHLTLACFGTTAKPSVNQLFTDFDLELDARKVSGSDTAWYGVVIITDKDAPSETDHRFLISGKGTYSYEVASFETPLRQSGLDIKIPAMLAPSIQKGDTLNHIRLIKKGSAVEFRVNHKRLFSRGISLEDTKQVEIAITILTPKTVDGTSQISIDVAFSNFVVYEPE